MRLQEEAVEGMPTEPVYDMLPEMTRWKHLREDDSDECCPISLWSHLFVWSFGGPTSIEDDVCR